MERGGFFTPHQISFLENSSTTVICSLWIASFISPRHTFCGCKYLLLEDVLSPLLRLAMGGLGGPCLYYDSGKISKCKVFKYMSYWRVQVL